MTQQLEPSSGPAHFRAVLGHYPTGIAVITAIPTGGEPVGMTVGTFMSVSLEPALVSFMADRSSVSFPRIRTAPSFCVNVLAEDQLAVCRAFAVRKRHKFTGLRWTPTTSGAPRLDGVAAWVEATIESVHAAGDHYVVLGRVRDLNADPTRRPLLFLNGEFGRFTPAA